MITSPPLKELSCNNPMGKSADKTNELDKSIVEFEYDFCKSKKSACTSRGQSAFWI